MKIQWSLASNLYVVLWIGSLMMLWVTYDPWVIQFELKCNTLPDEMVRSAKFSPDGKLIAIVGNESPLVTFFDADTGEKIKELAGHTYQPSDVFFAQKGTRMISDGFQDKTARVWDVDSGKCISVLNGHTANLTSAVLSEDGQLAITSSDDKTARLWDATSGSILSILYGHTESVSQAEVSSQSRLILTTSWKDETTRVYDFNGKNVAVIKGIGFFLTKSVFATNGNSVVSDCNDNNIRQFDAHTGELQGICSGHKNSITILRPLPDNKHLLSASFDGTARIWNLDTHKEIVCFGTTDGDWVNDAQISHDGMRVATAYTSGEVRLWDAHTGKAVCTLSGGHTDLLQLDFSPSDIQIAGRAYQDNRVFVWKKRHAEGIMGTVCLPAFWFTIISTLLIASGVVARRITRTSQPCQVRQI